MKKFSIILAVAMLFLMTWQASAMVFDPADFTYVIHLYYDGKKFVPNNGSKFQYDVISENFEQGIVDTEKAYVGEVISIKGDTLASFLFDPKYVNSKVARGPLDVKAPYFANAQSIKLYDDIGKLFLTINTGETSVCNENKVCDAEAGEDYLACPSDCEAQIPITPVVSATPIPTTGDDNMLWIILGAITSAIVIIWLIIKKRKNKNQNPPTNLPTIPRTPPVTTLPSTNVPKI